MDKYSSGREITKRKLTGNMIDPDTKVEVVKKKQVPVVLIVLLVTALLCGIFFVYRNFTYRAETASVRWEKETGTSQSAVTFRSFASFADGVIMYTKDGAEYTDRNGKSIWQKSYQMNNPAISVKENFAVIYDVGGTTACIFSDTASTGTVSTVMPIAKAAVSAIGVTYMVENDDGADFLMVYRKDGGEIDLSVKSVVSEDGYPFDIAVSPDASELLTSYIAVSENGVTESVVFRNFGEVGKNTDSRRVVGGFIEEFEGHIVSKLGFPDNTRSRAFYDGGICFFSTEVLNTPEIIRNVAIEETILSVADGTECCAVLTEGEQEGTNRLLIYDNEGKLTGSAEVEDGWTGFEATDAGVILYSSDRILEYSVSGTLIADLTWDGKISSVCGGKKAREFFVSEGGRLLYVEAQ